MLSARWQNIPSHSYEETLCLQHIWKTIHTNQNYAELLGGKDVLRPLTYRLHSDNKSQTKTKVHLRQ